jgi:hypothetical protein
MLSNRLGKSIVARRLGPGILLTGYFMLIMGMSRKVVYRGRHAEQVVLQARINKQMDTGVRQYDEEYFLSDQ